MPPDALILAQNAPKMRLADAGLARTRWGSLQRSPPPDPLAEFKGS